MIDPHLHQVFSLDGLVPFREYLGPTYRASILTLHMTLLQRHILQIGALTNARIVGYLHCVPIYKVTDLMSHSKPTSPFFRITAKMSDLQLLSIDNSRWRQRIALVTTSSGEQIRLSYIDCPPTPSAELKGTILLIHGFPQTSYQFRHVIDPLSDAGYRVIAPDYRGAGQSSKPLTGYQKTQMAEDLHILIQTHFGIEEKIHVVGHDIGGMIAFAYVSRYPEDVASVIWGECPLPGTSFYEEIKGSADVFHFVFHQVPDLPEFLIVGKEREYLKHFFDKISYNSAAIAPADLEQYALAYSQPGAMRAGLEVYRAFEKDAEENRKWVAEHGKVQVPSLLMMGKEFLLAQAGHSMASEYHDGAEVLTVEDTAHYIAEENPEGFVKCVLGFVGKH